MLIKLYSPFSESIGKDLLEIRIEGEISLSEFSTKLVEQFPSFRNYVTGEKSFDLLNSIFFVARKGTLLRPGDIVRDEDELEIMAPVEGG